MGSRPPAWRLLPATAADGFRQMALDQALLESASAEGFPPTLRFYRFDPPALTLGRFQPAGHADPEACRRRGFDIVRRPTGGKAILHKDDFTYSLVLPPSARMPQGVEESYAFICRGIIAALAALGIDAGLVPRGGGRSGVRACFSAPASADLQAGGRKLCGSAQTRRGGAILQHGTIPLKDHGDLLFSLLSGTADEAGEGPREYARACTCLEELTVGASWDEIALAFRHGFESEFRVRLVPGELTGAERAAADSLLQAYTSTAWSQLH